MSQQAGAGGRAPDANQKAANQVGVPDAVERLIGRGVIRGAGSALGETDYDITITPAHLRGAVTFEPGNEALGTNDPQGADISGRLLAPFYATEKLVEGVYTLVLEDGREFDFRVLQPETNEIVGVSWFRSPTTEGTRNP
jgi:hypothetical protein